jgi:hypothetical protein
VRQSASQLVTTVQVLADPRFWVELLWAVNQVLQLTRGRVFGRRWNAARSSRLRKRDWQQREIRAWQLWSRNWLKSVRRKLDPRRNAWPCSTEGGVR